VRPYPRRATPKRLGCLYLSQMSLDSAQLHLAQMLLYLVGVEIVPGRVGKTVASQSGGRTAHKAGALRLAPIAQGTGHGGRS